MPSTSLKITRSDRFTPERAKQLILPAEKRWAEGVLDHVVGLVRYFAGLRTDGHATLEAEAGSLRRSFFKQVKLVGHNLTGRVASNKSAAAVNSVESGAAAHWVSVKPGTSLARWAERRGLNKFAVQKRIAGVAHDKDGHLLPGGTAPKHMFELAKKKSAGLLATRSRDLKAEIVRGFKNA